MSIKDNCWCDVRNSDSVYYCGVMGSGYGFTYNIYRGKVSKWMWESSVDMSSGWSRIEFSKMPIEVQECFSDPLLEIELERFKISGEKVMDIL